MSETFSKRLKALRKEKRATQADIAALLHYRHTAVANYESGRNEPSIQDLVTLADFFQVSVDYLVGRTDAKTPSRPVQPPPPGK